MMPTRTEAYNTLIANIRATPPDFAKLTEIWKKVLLDRRLAVLREKYATARLTEAQLSKMAAVDVELYRKSLKDEAFNQELLVLHTQAIEASVQQLEKERDTPQARTGGVNRGVKYSKDGPWTAER
ncbi:MAG: hypothetical protein WBO10_14860 [Pyrinomonadaceae bacterium]